MNNVGEKIKQIRIARNYTQQDIADKMNIKRNTVSQWESGMRNISVEQLIEYAKVVGVTLDFFNDDSAERTLFQTMAELDKLFTSADLSSIDKDKAFRDIMNMYWKSKELAGIIVETPDISINYTKKAKEE